MARDQKANKELRDSIQIRDQRIKELEQQVILLGQAYETICRDAKCAGTWEYVKRLEKCRKGYEDLKKIVSKGVSPESLLRKIKYLHNAIEEHKKRKGISADPYDTSLYRTAENCDQWTEMMESDPGEQEDDFLNNLIN